MDSTKYIKIMLNSLPIFLLLLTIDQVSKSYIIEYLQTKEGMFVYVTKYLNIVYTWNYGISFGMFTNYYQYSNWFFTVLNSIIIVLSIIHYVKTYSVYHRYYSIGLLITVSGAAGNVADRIFRKGVFDFIDLHYQNYYFPAFNFADMCITFGTIIVIYTIIRFPFEENHTINKNI